MTRQRFTLCSDRSMPLQSVQYMILVWTLQSVTWVSGCLWLIFNLRWCWHDKPSRLSPPADTFQLSNYFVLGIIHAANLHKTSSRSTTCSSCYEWRVRCWRRWSYTHSFWHRLHRTALDGALSWRLGSKHVMVLVSLNSCSLWWDF